MSRQTPIELVHDRRDAGHSVARLARDRQGSAGGVDRSGQRLVRAAVLVRHDGLAEGRDADPSQPGGPAESDRCDRKRSDAGAARRAAVLSYLRHGDPRDAWADARLNDRHDAEVRVRAVPEGAAGLADRDRSHRPAGGRRTRQAPGGRQLQVPALEISVFGSRAARTRADRRRRETAQRQDPAGLRHDRGEPGHALHRRRHRAVRHGRTADAQHGDAHHQIRKPARMCRAGSRAKSGCAART